ncbi:MAG: carbamoyltransferase HypF [Candidatus Lokiarchaeota archaeon]|nr:carbamoyltransferase HypF [Candidatus Lokiarchaeota archaeon]
MIEAEIHITGVVQGVGFRPFVYRFAKKLGLKGYVLNLGDAGVRISVQGNRSKIQKLAQEIKNNPPSISRIESFQLEWVKSKERYTDFEIIKSSEKKTPSAIPEIPPDIAICPQCVSDLTDPNSRWRSYPFTSCAACGPRYSTIEDLPYDRPNTTMREFPLCNTCNKGYTNPMDRRYHAQTTACEKCGPRYTLTSLIDGKTSKTNLIERTMKILDKGLIVAIQGISGTHLVTKTSTPKPIEKLRERKKRYQRPFAIMIRDLETLQRICDVSIHEAQLLRSWKRPIVLIRLKEDYDVLRTINVIPIESLNLIAPELNTIGVMLPYSPMHYLMFQNSDEPAFVMTSANPTSIPMYIDPERIKSELKNIADYVLTHNRQIHQRVDDSVLKFVTKEQPVFIRRARGYVPEPILLSKEWDGFSLLSVGPEEKATGAVLKAGAIYSTQHIGDTDKIESLKFLEASLNNLMNILGVSKIEGIACDLHPQFLSSEFASDFSKHHRVPLYKVQHHHAHLASIIVDHRLDINTNITCITADGYGYGSDGSAWGGEVLVGGLKDFKKYGNVDQVIYPGGDLSARYPIRPFIGLLANNMDAEKIHELTHKVKVAPNQESSVDVIQLLQKVISKRINSISSSSVGRYLDAVALALGICSENTYDGECPMKLEAAAKESDLRLGPAFKNGGKTLDIRTMFQEIIEKKQEGSAIENLAYSAQKTIGEGLAQIAINASEENDTEYIGFSGGVALNRIITSTIIQIVEENGYKPLIHKRVPPGDGGISIGQIAVAAARHVCP